MVQIHPPLPTTMIKRDIELFLGPIIEASGCELWGIEITSGKGKGRILRIFIDAIQGVDLNDCEKIKVNTIKNFFINNILLKIILMCKARRWSEEKLRIFRGFS